MICPVNNLLTLLWSENLGSQSSGVLLVLEIINQHMITKNQDQLHRQDIRSLTSEGWLTLDQQGNWNTGFSLVILGEDLECPSIFCFNLVQGQSGVVDVAVLVSGDGHPVCGGHLCVFLGPQDLRLRVSHHCGFKGHRLTERRGLELGFLGEGWGYVFILQNLIWSWNLVRITTNWESFPNFIELINKGTCQM